MVICSSEFSSQNVSVILFISARGQFHEYAEVACEQAKENDGNLEVLQEAQPIEAGAERRGVAEHVVHLTAIYAPD